MSYIQHILIVVGIYIMLSQSLNLVSGCMGVVTLAQAAFYGLGAYSTAVISTRLGASLPTSLIVAGLLALVFGFALSLPSLRLRSHYYLVATFAFQILASNLMSNWISLTGGPMGIPDIPLPRIAAYTISSRWVFLSLVVVFDLLTLLFCSWLIKSPFGRVLKSIREDEVLGASIGKNVAKFKMLVFALSALIAAMAGVFYAHYMTFIDPNSFTVMGSIFILSMVIVGGTGTVTGPVLGAILLVIVPEFLRFIGLPTSLVADLREMLYGGLLVLFMIFRPQGLIAEQVGGKKAVRA